MGSEGEAEVVLGVHQVSVGLHQLFVAHEHFHKAHAEGGERKARHVLVGAQGDGEEGVDKPHQRAHQEGTQYAQYHDQEGGKARLHAHVNHQAAARAAHAHNARDAQVKMTRLFGDYLAGGAVHEGGSEAQGVY